MARTVSEIKKSMTDVFISNETIMGAYGLRPGKTFEDEFSVSSVESIFFYCISFGVFILENLFGTHKTEVVDYIANMKPHSLQWYANIAKSFQFGHVLPNDTDKYDNTGLTDEQIEASKIVDYAAVEEQQIGLRIKIATDNGNDLEALSAQQLESFSAFMARVKDAGVKLLITSGPADSLKLQLLIKYDPLVLNANGQRIDGANNTPVQDAIENYLKNLPFNGKLEMSSLIDEIQKVEGVVAPYIQSASAKYGSLQYTSISNQSYIPDAGYVRLYDETDLQITWQIAA